MKLRAWLALWLALLVLAGPTAAIDSSQSGKPPARKAALVARRVLRHAPDGESLHLRHSSEEKDDTIVRASPEVNMWPGILMATLAGASTVLGAVVILFMPESGPPPSAMAFSFSLAAGVMIAISVEMLIPHDSEGNEGKLYFSWEPLLIFCVGAFCCALLCKLADCFESTSVALADADGEKADNSEDQVQKKRFRLSALLFVSLTLHNFPEGFAVAVSALSGVRYGLTMCIAVAFHNIPEGIALAVSVYDATKSYAQSFLWTALSGLTEPLGAFCAMVLIKAYLTFSHELLHNLLTGVAGVMCYVALAELLPEAISTRCWSSIVSGFITGVAVMVLTHWVMDEIESPELEASKHWFNTTATPT
jgi:ZIP family zinc transporter